jgi:hypothetical protein
MLRCSLLLPLVACDLSSGGVPNHLDGTYSNPDLGVEVYVDLTTCDGAPCTPVTVALHAEGATARLDDATVTVSGDGEPPVTALADPANATTYAFTLDHWIAKVRIDVMAGPDHAALWSDATITTPVEANIQLPDLIVLGQPTSLTWTSQGDPVVESIVFATNVSPMRFGFLTTRSVETGSYELGPDVLNGLGQYHFALTRELEHFLDDEADHHLYLSWSSSWQKTVTVVQPPPT